MDCEMITEHFVRNGGRRGGPRSTMLFAPFDGLYGKRGRSVRIPFSCDHEIAEGDIIPLGWERSETTAVARVIESEKGTITTRHQGHVDGLEAMVHPRIVLHFAKQVQSGGSRFELGFGFGFFEHSGVDTAGGEGIAAVCEGLVGELV